MLSKIPSDLEVVFNAVLEGRINIQTKEVKAQKKSGVIYVPMKYIGRRVILIFKK